MKRSAIARPSPEVAPVMSTLFILAEVEFRRQMEVVEAQALLGVAGDIYDARQRAGGHTQRHAPFARVEADVHLVVVVVKAGAEEGRGGADAVQVSVLRVRALGETRVVLLDAVAVYGIVQEEGEVREQIQLVCDDVGTRPGDGANRALLQRKNGSIDRKSDKTHGTVHHRLYGIKRCRPDAVDLYAYVRNVRKNQVARDSGGSAATRAP